jgi:hypothetical protein
LFVVVRGLGPSAFWKGLGYIHRVKMRSFALFQKTLICWFSCSQ